MSNESGNNNRSKVLFGFGAVVAVLIAAILLWPSNVRKEDASGAIGAVQKHHAPQITPQDVVLGGEQLKAQQKVLYTDFREDSAKLRSLAANRNEAAMRLFEQELAMRAHRVADEAVAAVRVMNVEQAADVEQLAGKLRSEEQLSDVELNQLALRLNALAETEQAAFARIDQAKASFAKINLNDEQQVAMRLRDVEAAVGNLDRDMELASRSQYLGMLAEEVSLCSRAGAQAADFEALAMKLDSRATANERMLADEEAQLAVRLAEVDSALSMRYNSAEMMNSSIRANISQAAARISQRASLARTMSRANANVRSN